MNVKIEPVQVDELPLLLDISRRTFYDTFHDQNTEEDLQLFLQTAFSDAVLKNELEEGNNYFFFARIDDQLAGYLKLSTLNKAALESNALEISRIYVVQEKLGFGIGKALLLFAISFAQEHKKNILYLGVWEHNLRAIAFYKNFGFQKTGEEKFLLGNDVQTDWVMKKSLLEK